jgi:hypothetical protein
MFQNLCIEQFRIVPNTFPHILPRGWAVKEKRELSHDCIRTDLSALQSNATIKFDTSTEHIKLGAHETPMYI